MAAYDFSGWATRNDIKCSDGRTIRRDAFKECDGKKVPLVWNHNHDDPSRVLGHSILWNKPEGVRADCYFNETENADIAKVLIKHGDIDSLSIYANHLKQNGGDVLHGVIREVSLVQAGANPGAYIDSVMIHNERGEDVGDEAIIYSGDLIDFQHSDENVEEHEELEHADSKKEDANVAEEKKPEATDEKEKTVQEVFDSLTEEQKTVVYALIGQAVEDATGGSGENEEEDKENMKHNVFEQDNDKMNVITHSEMKAVIDDAKRYGSMKESALQHGIENIDYLFPEAKSLNNPPDWIKRDTGWVTDVMNGVHHTPFSRIKSQFADITEDDARAKGYIKGNLKKEEVFSLLKRTTSPTTVYKKQKLDRDDVVDITDFDVIAWLKSEMRIMLDEELARAYLIGDGRLNSSDDKIKEDCIRPIAFDEELYTIQVEVEVDQSDASIKYKNFIKQAIRARKNYKGSGSPTLYTTEDVLTECLLLEDTIGHALYEDEAALARKLRVKKIVTVPVMENVKGKNTEDLLGVIVNLTDYNVGADKGGAVNLFDDFDIDYNAQKYLIETRCSGALTKPFSAIALCVKHS